MVKAWGMRCLKSQRWQLWTLSLFAFELFEANVFCVNTLLLTWFSLDAKTDVKPNQRRTFSESLPKVKGIVQNVNIFGEKAKREKSKQGRKHLTNKRSLLSLCYQLWSCPCSVKSWVERKLGFHTWNLKYIKLGIYIGLENEVRRFLEVSGLEMLQNLMITIHKCVLKLDNRHWQFRGAKQWSTRLIMQVFTGNSAADSGFSVSFNSSMISEMDFVLNCMEPWVECSPSNKCFYWSCELMICLSSWTTVRRERHILKILIY